MRTIHGARQRRMSITWFSSCPGVAPLHKNAHEVVNCGYFHRDRAANKSLITFPLPGARVRALRENQGKAKILRLRGTDWPWRGALLRRVVCAMSFRLSPEVVLVITRSVRGVLFLAESWIVLSRKKAPTQPTISEDIEGPRNRQKHVSLAVDDCTKTIPVKP